MERPERHGERDDGEGPSVASRVPALGPRGEGWVALQGVLLAGELAALLAGPAWSGGARIATTAIGSLVAGAGLALAGAGLRELGPALTPLPRPVEGAPIATGGAYGLVRHPVYGGIVLAAGGLGLAAAAPPAVAGAALLLGFFTLKSIREEAWLVARHPAYDAYRRGRRRLLPFAW